VISDLAIFGLERLPSRDELKSLWRAYALKTHPDRGGDAEKFWHAHAAYVRLCAEIEAPRACAECRGTGVVKAMAGFYHYLVRCEACDGSGRINA
jgi:DnaJ-class molecular chaperone